MYAIIQTGSKQYWVSPGDTLRVEKLAAKPGEEIVLPALWAGKEEVAEGAQPQAEGAQPQGEGASPQGAGAPPEGGAAAVKAQVTAEVLRQGRARKVLVFKKKPKSHYRKRAGHRQDFTEIRIKGIQ